MITIECDRCERAFEVPGEQAGEKVPCPHCGDINRVPGVRTEAMVEKDRAEAAGLPPDRGPEQKVMLVRPAMLRAKPMVFLGLVVVMVGGSGLAVWIGVYRTNWMALAWLSGIAAGLAAIGLFVWKIHTFGAALEITNKRTVERRGLFSKATSEVLHDNIRNVQVDQTFWQRVWNVGTLGLSSSGQDGIEIQMRNVPKPEEVRRIIDLYRPL